MIAEGADPTPSFVSSTEPSSQLADARASMHMFDMPVPSAVEMGAEAAAPAPLFPWTPVPFEDSFTATPIHLAHPPTTISMPVPAAINPIAPSSRAATPEPTVERSTPIAEPASRCATSSIADAALPAAAAPGAESGAANALLSATPSIENNPTVLEASVQTSDPAKLSPTPSVDGVASPSAVPSATLLAAEPTVLTAKPAVVISSTEPPPSIAQPVAPAEPVVTAAASIALTTAEPSGPQGAAEPAASTEQLSTVRFLTPCKRKYIETVLLGFSENLEADETKEDESQADSKAPRT
jgi:hypothetical protein